MRRARMMVMQIDGQLLPQSFVAAHGVFEKALLKIAWQIRPKRQCGPSHVNSLIAGHRSPFFL
jgi:hypothetical protein